MTSASPAFSAAASPRCFLGGGEHAQRGNAHSPRPLLPAATVHVAMASSLRFSVHHRPRHHFFRGSRSLSVDDQLQPAPRAPRRSFFGQLRMQPAHAADGHGLQLVHPDPQIPVHVGALSIATLTGGAGAGATQRDVDDAVSKFLAAVLLACQSKTSAGQIQRLENPLEKLVIKRHPPTLAMTLGAQALQEPSSPALLKPLLLAGMLFLILFNYTILRDMKDAVLLSVAGLGAEAIPFIKTVICTPLSILFVLFYSAASSRLSREHLFYVAILPFLVFFATLSIVIYPNLTCSWLRPNALAYILKTTLPTGFHGLITLFHNWPFTLFYALAELWGPVVISLLFWGFSNEVMSVDEAKRYYPVFGLVANLALLLSSRVAESLRARMPRGADNLGLPLNYMMGMLVAGMFGIVGLFCFLSRLLARNRKVAGEGHHEETSPGEGQAEGEKCLLKMGLMESIAYLAGSPYIQNLMMLVVCYGLTVSLVEGAWKGKLKEQFPNPNAGSFFIGDFLPTTSTAAFAGIYIAHCLQSKFGWGAAALVTPTILCGTGLLFFALVLFEQLQQLAPVTKAILGSSGSALQLAVLAGAVQNIFSEPCKFSLFDPYKEMAFVPLDPEARLKGKVAIDVIGSAVSQCSSVLIQQLLIFGMGSLAASVPALAGILVLMTSAWVTATRSLVVEFNKKMESSSNLKRERKYEEVDLQIKCDMLEEQLTETQNALQVANARAIKAEAWEKPTTRFVHYILNILVKRSHMQ